ncbi:MAG: ATP-binding protein [Mariprofundaceae bacterium]
MKSPFGRQGLSFKLTAFGLALLIIPWLGLRYIQEMKSFLIEGQKEALLMASQAVAMALHERDDLFHLYPGTPASVEETLLYAHPLEKPIRIDGRGTGWSAYRSSMRYFNKILFSDSAKPDNDLRMGILIGQRKNYLNVRLEIRDNQVIYRHADYRRLDNSDHIRLSFVDQEGLERRYIVTVFQQGATSAFISNDWKHAITGRDETRILGYWKSMDGGYSIELRIPMSMMDRKLRLGFAVVDVDDRLSREIAAIVGTYGASESLNPVLLRSPEMERIIRGLDRPGARIWIIDQDRRVRTEVGGFRQSKESVSEQGLWDQFLAFVLQNILNRPIAAFVDHDPGIDVRNDAIIYSALDGSEGVELRLSTDSMAEIIMAASPIRVGNRVLGAVLLEQSTNDILSLQRKTLEKVMGTTLLVFLGLITGLLFFAFRQTWRIHRLRSETLRAISHDGRVLEKKILAESKSEDVIGDLSRGISMLLERLSSHTSFLERIPRTLKHEINNPLNSLSTSLQNLEGEIPEVAKSKYMQSADRGIKRLGNIVQGMTDASNLESALAGEERENFDVCQLLKRYVENCSARYPSFDFHLSSPDTPIIISGSGFRIEQLLDKLIDNAVDFSEEGSRILVEAQSEGSEARITIANNGPLLPADIQGQLFDSMVSGRSPGRETKPHLGIGLYVVRVIAEHHSGRVKIQNKEDLKGVSVSVLLPLQPGVV